MCPPPRPLLGLFPVWFVPDPDPAPRTGGPGRALHRARGGLGLHGHHLDPQTGGGPAVLQRVLGERRAEGRQLRGALHVPDPHGDLRAGPAGEPDPGRVTRAGSPGTRCVGTGAESGLVRRPLGNSPDVINVRTWRFWSGNTV